MEDGQEGRVGIVGVMSGHDRLDGAAGHRGGEWTDSRGGGGC